MWYLIAIIIAAAGIILGFVSCYSGNSARVADPVQDSFNHPDDSIRKQLTRQELLEKMAALAKKEPPKELSQGAMCYKVAMPEDRAEYVCPVCGEKTLYESSSGVFINQDLAACRSIAENLTEVNARLDETEFCRKCKPKHTGEPTICLVTQLKDEAQTHSTCGITLEDMQILQEFFRGKLTHRDDYDYETPLRDKLIEISRLLGVEITDK